MSRQLGAIWEAAVREDFILVRADNKGRNKWNCTLLDGTYHPPVVHWKGYYDIDTLVKEIAFIRTIHPVGPLQGANACSVVAQYTDEIESLRNNTQPNQEVEQEEEITEVPESDYQDAYATGYQDGFEAAVSSGNSTEDLEHAFERGTERGRSETNVVYGEVLEVLNDYESDMAIRLDKVRAGINGIEFTEADTQARRNSVKDFQTTLIQETKERHDY